jgi:NAD(P)-dependent dehydrogenase (short-subunit alcohol dehydrogenase family)
MNHGAKAAILGRQCVNPFIFFWLWSEPTWLICIKRLDRVNAAAKELTSKTGQECLALQCDVRDPKSMHEAAAKTVEKFGKIDFVICGTFTL